MTYENHVDDILLECENDIAVEKFSKDKLTKTQYMPRMSECGFYRNVFQGEFQRVLFVCSVGMLRSATAAAMGVKAGLNTRACGSSSIALIPISDRLVKWADKIVFLNKENYEESFVKFQDSPVQFQMKDKAYIWEIEDNYEYMADDLVWILKDKIEGLVNEK